MYFKTGEFSKLTGISVRSLQYYDYLGLLNPSERDSNGFRLYSREDLQHLLAILALKFLGFDLVTIKGILNESLPVHEQLIAKKKQVVEEIENLIKVKNVIENIKEVAKTAPLELVIKLIQINRAAIYLRKRRVRKLFPRYLREKTKEYEKRIAFILLQLDAFDYDELSGICDDFLKQVRHEIPEVLTLQ